MSGTPWWNTLIAPGATLIAFALGILASWWSDKRKWAREDQIREITQQREDELRYHKDKLEAYAGLLTQCELLVLVSGAPGGNTAVDKIGYMHAATVETSKIQLIAEPKVGAAANQLLQTALANWTDMDSSAEDMNAYIDAEKKFREAARVELGIDLPPRLTPK